MNELTIRVPEYLRKQAQAVAEREQISLDELISLALASHVSAWQAKDYMQERGRQGSWDRFKAVLDKAPDIEPIESDRLPEGYSRTQ